eukprot:2305888-Alexandrium_andersonii.AAC.1
MRRAADAPCATAGLARAWLLSDKAKRCAFTSSMCQALGVSCAEREAARKIGRTLLVGLAGDPFDGGLDLGHPP